MGGGASILPTISRTIPYHRPVWNLSMLSEEISPDTETAMKELVEKYRPVRQRTVRGETTEDKAGASPMAVYSKEQDCTE